MKLGIDLRPLQNGHKYRGIGEVTKQLTSHIVRLAEQDKSHDTDFIFYEYDEDDDPKYFLDLPETLKYEVVKVGRMPENHPTASKKEKLSRNYKQTFGNQITQSSKSDVLLQFDYNFGVPTDTRTVLVKHDIIPYIFWNQYFESAWVPFKNKAARTTIRTMYANFKYKYVLTRSLKNAHKIVTISESTKKDILSFTHLSNKKISVIPLGVSARPVKTQGVDTSDLPTKPYLLFIGAGDARRRVDDLVAAYNNLKASGRDIQLVLVGENFKTQEGIPNKQTRDAILESSYKSDILTMGYIDDETKQELYKSAIAFVFPTLYEGFGLPVLESMVFRCPVITYRNSSIPEVAGNYALYANDWDGIKKSVGKLLDMKNTERDKFIDAAEEYAKGFTWEKTAQKVYDVIKSV